MAPGYNTPHMPPAPDASIAQGLNDRAPTSEEEAISDVDEPPDDTFRFSRVYTAPACFSSPEKSNRVKPTLSLNTQNSLLTQALLATQDPAPSSDTDAPTLISDGGLTSPTRTNTPSPPLPATQSNSLALLISDNGGKLKLGSPLKPVHTHELNKTGGGIKGDTEQGRRKCITFACGRQSPPKVEHGQVSTLHTDSANPAEPPKRPCMLRFICPMKPSNASAIHNGNTKPRKPIESTHSTDLPVSAGSTSPLDHRRHRGSDATIQKSPQNIGSGTAPVSQHTDLSKDTRRRLESSEATRFHEFAGSFDVEDEWIRKQKVHGHKLTVNDTLRKENAIRKLTEEAEEEQALEEEDEQEADLCENSEDPEDEDYFSSDNEASDGGNETDDEEGFADSDDDSDHGSHYQFWSPDLTTAATSAEHLDHIRPITRRVASDSSFESMINTQDQMSKQPRKRRQGRGNHSYVNSMKLRPGTPDLPDSTDFVCGTFDEDRPLEAAYMSCLEERRRARHRIIPQDIDPSFPTSETDEEDENDDDGADTQTSDEHILVMGVPDNSDEDQPITRFRHRKSPMPSPKRLRSPAPLRRTFIPRSPPPRCLFGRSPVRLTSPLAAQHRVNSPPSSRRTSFSGSPNQKTKGMTMPCLAQRPHLTHTRSLPRTPNPYWHQHHQSQYDESDRNLAETSPNAVKNKHRGLCSRGPINIVKGLENKRQWRKEKLWRQQCRHAGKEKERKCQPGKGAERMKELGLEMAGKVKGYAQRPTLVLSI